MVASVGITARLASAEQGSEAYDDGKTDETGMPYGKIGDLTISRLILGSNIPGAHSRDLIYVGALGKAYNTKERMLDTFELAESQGINTVLQGNTALIEEYNATRGGHLRQIRPLKLARTDNQQSIERRIGKLIEQKAAALYVFGDSGDYLARDGRVDVIGIALDVAKDMGMLLGVGGHSLQVVIQCEEHGLKPAFYLKTFHHDNYWSATPRENRKPFCWYDGAGGNSYSGKTADHNQFHDNIWCLDPEKTIEVMRNVTVPWIAFKVLAAGAIHPRQGFGYAFRNGADFIAVGMLDFQIQENANITQRLVGSLSDRERPWQA